MRNQAKPYRVNWAKLLVLFLLFNEAANYAATAFMDHIDHTFDAGSVWCAGTAALYLATATAVFFTWRRD